MATATEEQPIINDSRKSISIRNASSEVRIGFVRKVYSILTAQLLLTVAIAAPFQNVSQDWIMRNQWLLLVSVLASVSTMCAMVCCRDAARQFPTNYAMLFVFTTFEGVLVGFLSAAYTWESVLLAAGITVGVFILLTVYACFTKTDFTGMGPYLVGALMTFMMFGLVMCVLSAFGVYVPVLKFVYDLAGVLIFVFYIIYDTQLILGDLGGHQHQFSIDDYAFAALQLYLDIINLFIHILAILGKRR